MNRLRPEGVLTQTVAWVDGPAVGIEATVFVRAKIEKRDTVLFRTIDRALICTYLPGSRVARVAIPANETAAARCRA